MKKFIVNIDRKLSEDIVVSAKNSREAKKKAWAKFQKKKPKKNIHDIYVDEA